MRKATVPCSWFRVFVEEGGRQIQKRLPDEVKRACAWRFVGRFESG